MSSHTPTPPQPDTTLHHCDFECSGRHGDTTDGELEKILRDFGNKVIGQCASPDADSTSDFEVPNLLQTTIAALKARDTRREAEAKSLAQQQGFLAGFRWGFNSVDEDVATEECRKWQATLKEKTKDE